MRYLELPELEELSAALSNAAPSEGTRLSCRVEAYTCKAAGADKKLLVQLLRRYRAAPERRMRGSHAAESGAESSWEDVLGAAGADSLESLAAEAGDDSAQSPAERPAGRRRPSIEERPRAPNADAELPAGMSLKALYYLVSTMNLVFSDYDLVAIDPRCFVAQADVESVVRGVDAALGASATPRLWDLVSSAVGPLEECAVYTFDPQPTRLSVLDETDDPFWERGYLWSLNYFFYSRRQRRMLMVAVHAESVLGQGLEERPSQCSLAPAASQDAAM